MDCRTLDMPQFSDVKYKRIRPRAQLKKIYSFSTKNIMQNKIIYGI